MTANQGYPQPVSIRLRAHTLLCLQGFRGEGYSREFVENLTSIHRLLLERPDQLIEVIDVPDAVCAACPHRASSGCTLHHEESEMDMRAQDRHVLGLLDLTVGCVVPWHEVLTRIRVALTGDDLPDICGRCPWLPLGYCRDGMNHLLLSDQAGILSPVPSSPTSAEPPCA